MAWIELTMAEDGKKTVVNTRHIIRFSSPPANIAKYGSYVFLSIEASWSGDSLWLNVEETMADIERLIARAGDGAVIR